MYLNVGLIIVVVSYKNEKFNVMNYVKCIKIIIIIRIFKCASYMLRAKHDFCFVVCAKSCCNTDKR